MGTNPSVAANLGWRTVGKRRSVQTCLLLLSCLLLVTCSSVRPVIKIGLVAPFEGLHRQSGYMALAAMRQAIADFAPANVVIMPLAMDDTADANDAQRAVRKMLQDEAVGALVGPYNLALAQSVQPELAATGLPWLLPFVIDPIQGFVLPDAAGSWALPLVSATAEAAQQQDAARLIVAGWSATWPIWGDAPEGRDFALPVLVSDDVAVLQPQDAILWLGAPETGAAYLATLRTQFPAIAVFLGPQADSPIFSELVQITGPVYSLVWLDDGYEQWRMQNPAYAPMAYLTYRATAQAIAASLDQPLPPVSAWRVEILPLASAGDQ